MEEIHGTNISPRVRGTCILLIVVMICLIGTLGGYLNRVLHTGLFDFITIFLLSVSGWMVYRWLILEYRYRTDGTVLLIETLSGKRYKTVCRIELQSMKKSGIPTRPYPLTGRFYVWKERKKLQEIVFMDGRKEKRIIISPGEKLAAILNTDTCKYGRRDLGCL